MRCMRLLKRGAPGLAFLVATLANLPAQELRGRIQGVVTDASGAVVVGAKVTLANVNTNVPASRETDGTGRYLFDLVLRGSYTVTVEMAGFKTFIQENILVQTRADLTVNASLEVGAANGPRWTPSPNSTCSRTPRTPSSDTVDTSKISIQPPYTRRTNPVQWPGFTGPRYGNVDLTLAKTHKMTEKIGLEVRREACNATNSFMSAGPNTSVTSANFGKITSQRNRSFGRQVQYTAWLRW